jgi:hypothetical protein
MDESKSEAVDDLVPFCFEAVMKFLTFVDFCTHWSAVLIAVRVFTAASKI